MAMQWAKSYLPRTLYGRAALILLVPVLALQLVVSVVFIQRHYAGVTEQMTRNVVLELRLLRGIVEAAGEIPIGKVQRLRNGAAARFEFGQAFLEGQLLLVHLVAEHSGDDAENGQQDNECFEKVFVFHEGPLKLWFKLVLRL